MVHEFPDAAIASRQGAKLLLAEPSGHVDEKQFEEVLQAASSAGFASAIRRIRAAVLVKNSAFARK